MIAVICCVLALASFTNGQSCGRKIPQRAWPLPRVPPGPQGPDARIVGGRDSFPEHYWPWQLSLQFNRENTTTWGHTCGASIIDPYWAVTAAHCVTGRMVGLDDPRRDDPANFRLILGINSMLVAETEGQIRYIDMIIKHERWIPNPYLGYPNDIALLRLTQEADLTSDDVELACIPKQSDLNFTNEECWITGWGLMDSKYCNISDDDNDDDDENDENDADDADDGDYYCVQSDSWRDDFIPAILQEALVEQISIEVCRDLNFGYIRDSHICAGTGFPNACSGDSGGPMNCHKDGTWYVAGLASWTIAFCNGIPAVYTRVSSFWEWIQLIITFYRPTAHLD